MEHSTDPVVGGVYTATGGARIGWINASWPLAKLTAKSDELHISGMLGSYRFAAHEVFAVEKYVMIPIVGWGIRICHIKSDCPQKVIFWYLGNPQTVLEKIRRTGFVPLAWAKAPIRNGMALRWSAVIATMLIWNGLFFLDALIHPLKVGEHPSPLILAPLVFAVAISIGTLLSPSLQRIVLKPGRSVGEIKSLLLLILVISSVLLVVFSICVFTGALTYTGH